MALTNRFSFRKQVLYNSILAGSMVMLSSGASAQSSKPQEVRSIEIVTVTARRREESAQNTPVSVSALNSETIYRQNITELDDLTSAVPGVNFSMSGGANNTVFSIRGRSRGVFGNALPAVTTYVNEVPLSTWGGNVPSYDLASLQVLKGPQGTLFGRNSTAGAVLVTTERPDYELGGYGLFKVGEYSARVIEGAINVPIVDEKVALRLAAQFDQRDGYTEDMVRPNDDDFGNHDRDNFRVSLLLEPTEGFSNLSIYERNNIDERSVPVIPTSFDTSNPNTAIAGVPYYNGKPFPAGFIIDPASPIGISPCGGDPSCDIFALEAQQRAAGPRKAWADIPAFLKQTLVSVGNITTWDIGNITLKNVFGYRDVDSHSLSDIDGTQLPMINADTVVNIEQYSNELQLSGTAMDDKLDYIGGLFWLKSKPSGGNRLALQLFAQSGTPLNSLGGAPFNGAFGAGDFYTDTSQAIFGQVSYDLESLAEGLSADIGLRYTEDESESCPVPGTHVSTPVPTLSQCLSGRTAKFSKTTYNLGLNYQASDELLIYAVTRTGYRAGGVNSPNLGGTLTPFQSYEPETVQDVELGLKSDWTLGDIYGRFNLALFSSDYKDVHFANPTQAVNQLLPGGTDGDGDPSNDPSGGLFYGSAGDASVKGVELELIVQLSQSLKLSFGGSYMDKSVDLDFELPSNYVLLPPGFEPASESNVEAFVFLAAPDWSYTTALDYTLPLSQSLGEVVLSANYFQISDVNYGGQIQADAYDKVDLRADWFGIVGSKLDAAVYVSNATDEEAVIAASSSGPGLGMNSGIYNEPRMWGASLRYSF